MQECVEDKIELQQQRAGYRSTNGPDADIIRPEFHPNNELKEGNHDGEAKVPQWYHNDLMAAVGWLDVTNALDFPANVWNQVPIPLFARLLMGFGGAIAVLWVGFAIWDLRRSSQNIKVLRAERAWLWSNRRRYVRCSVEQPNQLNLVDAWLNINSRELGWELIDRSLMDILLGFSGILVGTGTFMAIRGDVPVIFHASNLLSGYVGNSFIAINALASLLWCISMWRRASWELGVIARAQTTSELRSRMRRRAFADQLYAFLNSVTALIGSAGSLLSATKWAGYIIVAPCAAGSIFCNLFWRHKLGYSRLGFQSWAYRQEFDIQERLEELNALRLLLHEKKERSVNITKLLMGAEGRPQSVLVRFMREHGMWEQYSKVLGKKHGVDPVANGCQHVTGTCECPYQVVLHDQRVVMDAARECLEQHGRHRFRDEERFLLELYACYLGEQEHSNRWSRPLPDKCEARFVNS